MNTSDKIKKLIEISRKIKLSIEVLDLLEPVIEGVANLPSRSPYDEDKNKRKYREQLAVCFKQQGNLSEILPISTLFKSGHEAAMSNLRLLVTKNIRSMRIEIIDLVCLPD